MSSVSLSRLCFDENDPMLNEEVKCNHGKVLPLMTAWTKYNPGRRYWACPYFGGSRSCKFFRWRDEEIDGRSMFVIPKLMEKMRELEVKLEAYQNAEKQRPNKIIEEQTREMELNFCIDKISKMEAEITKMKAKERKLKTKSHGDQYGCRKIVIWCILLCTLAVGVTYSLQLINLEDEMRELPLL